jgi:hypothetical protein
MKLLSLLLLGFSLNLHAQADFNSVGNQKNGKPIDLIFKSNATPVNPFSVQFSADITGPKGIKLTLHGFYDGHNTWKIRFYPLENGKWSFLTHADLRDLDNQERILNYYSKLKNSKDHGRLMIDPKNTRHFIYGDGTKWFPLGYECDWLWALDTNDPKLPTINTFLDKIAGCGFNMVLLNAYAYDTDFSPGKTADDDYGPATQCAWEGTNQHPDFDHFNLAYWQHYDRVIDALYQRGIVAHIYLKVYNKKVNWPQNESPEDDLYFRWIIARYAAYPNIIWDLAKEANNEKSVPYKTARLQFIRREDPYQNLLTVHTDIGTYNKGAYNGLVDFRTDQYQDNVHEVMLKNLTRNPWPIMNVESGYEYGPKGPKDKTYSSAQSPEEVARRIWIIQMAGGYNAYYYTYTGWDVIRPADTPPGYAYLKNFHDFFNTTNYWMMTSNDSLVNKGYCLVNPGKEYVVFQNDATPFTLTIAGLKRPLKAVWLQPYTGKYIKAGPLKNGMITLTPPTEFGAGPVVLHVGR